MPKFLLPVFILTLLSSVGFGYVVLKLDPEQTSSVVLFLITLFFSLTFTLSLVFFFTRRKSFFTDDLRPLFRTSFRNAFLIALLATIILVLQRLL